MSEIKITISDEVLDKLNKLSKEFGGVDPENLVSKIINDIILYEIDEVIEYMKSHNYGEMSSADKISTGLLDLIELGITTHVQIEKYLLEVLDTKNYWLEDYGLDLNDLSAWFLLTGMGLVEEIIFDIDRDGVSVAYIHSIEDLVSERPSIVDEIDKVIQEIDMPSGVDVIVEDDEIKFVARVKSIEDVVKVKTIEDILQEIFKRIGIARS